MDTQTFMIFHMLRSHIWCVHDEIIHIFCHSIVLCFFFLYRNQFLWCKCFSLINLDKCTSWWLIFRLSLHLSLYHLLICGAHFTYFLFTNIYINLWYTCYWFRYSVLLLSCNWYIIFLLAHTLTISNNALLKIRVIFRFIHLLCIFKNLFIRPTTVMWWLYPLITSVGTRDSFIQTCSNDLCITFQLFVIHLRSWC